jgi:hypothetical protein
MKTENMYIVCAVLALLLAIGVTVRITLQQTSFNRAVQEALETSEGYDERFINMVNKLEEELARRASFGYTGGKDPMTGKKRSVVLHHKRVRRPSRTRKKGEKQPPPQQVDPVKLTAIIFDDEKRTYTAIVMDGERSYSVEMGDRVRNRKITRISNDELYMESPTALYKYDIYGNSQTRKK